ncbi:MAG: NACHT domain-containing protein [Nostoc sp.]
MTRSLRASKAGIEKAKAAFKLKGWTQDYLAGVIGSSRQTIINCFAKRAVDKRIFHSICTALDLDWVEIAELEDGEEQANKTFTIDELVQEIREKVRPYIQERCSTMRVLDMSQSIGLDDIYTNVNILEQITGRRRLKIEDLQAELLQNSDVEELSRFGLCVTQKRVPGLEAVQQHSKLMVLGKPGAGKTTFMKYLAMQCIEGQFQSDRVPIFITLKDFAETPKHLDLLEYIAQRFSQYKVRDTGITAEQIVIAEQLLANGKALVLLDGLDEVREEDTKRVVKEVQEFSYQFHTNQLVITCRIAAKEYTFQGFTEVEVADFNSKQIATFAQKWFRLTDPVKGENFIQKLEGNKPIEELATNPLLLTLLCLVFGEAGNFPTNRSELYKEGIDVLLKKWDAKRNIERDRVYKDLSLQRKEDLLSQIALITFEQKDYFFKQKTVEVYIADFIFNLPNARTQPKELELDSEAVLKSIEAQHGLLVGRATGIYSFSHLTFQEYFAAREIKERSSLASLIEHITEKRWREVFLLTVGMMRKADDLVLLMKQKIDGLLSLDEKLQEFLVWVDEKARSVDTPYKLVAVRAFYTLNFIDYIYFLDKNLSWQLASYNEPAIDPEYERYYDDCLQILQEREALELGNDYSDYNPTINPSEKDRTPFNLDLAIDLNLDNILSQDLNPSSPGSFTCNLDRAISYALDSQLQQKLQSLCIQLSAFEINTWENWENWENWWQQNGQAWTEQLRAVIIEHRNFGYDWQFSDEQKELLEQYYHANKLLIDCLNSECYVSREVRQQIEETLLLPVKTDAQ